MNKKIVILGALAGMTALVYFFIKAEKKYSKSDSKNSKSEEDKKNESISDVKDMRSIIEEAKGSGQNNFISVLYNNNPEKFEQKWNSAKITSSEYSALLKFIVAFKSTMTEKETLKMFSEDDQKLIKSAIKRLRFLTHKYKIK